MSNFRNVSKREPCPICGKPDWCSIQEASPSTQLYYCRRILSGIDIISPVNNREYVYIKQQLTVPVCIKTANYMMPTVTSGCFRTADTISGTRERNVRSRFLRISPKTAWLMTLYQFRQSQTMNSTLYTALF